MPNATNRVVHESASGPLVATFEEDPANRENKYGLVIHDTGSREGKPLVAVGGESVRHLAAECTGAEKLIEYLSHGFPYGAWRENYDPTYHPDTREPKYPGGGTLPTSGPGG